jgi:hypothetical protein
VQVSAGGVGERLNIKVPQKTARKGNGPEWTEGRHRWAQADSGWLDLPGLNITAVARGFGCRRGDVDSAEADVGAATVADEWRGRGALIKEPQRPDRR